MKNGTYQRKGGAVCKDLPSLLDKLIYCELMNEKVETLEDMRQRGLHAIHSEVNTHRRNSSHLCTGINPFLPISINLIHTK
ncbi:hypothetical protein MZA99_03690 [Haemophilus influenzae]